MKHLVFIVGSYYPRFCAVGNCAHQVIKELKGEFRITVIAIKDEGSSADVVDLDGILVTRVATAQVEKRIGLKTRLSSGNKAIDRMRFFALRLRGAMRRLFSRETIDWPLVEAYKRQLCRLEEVDVIIPLVFPFESVVAALGYAELNSRVAVIPYLFDNFVDSRSLHVTLVARELKRKRHIALEGRMIDRSYAILAMHQLEHHFRRYFEPLIDAKFTFVEHPLLVQPAPSRPRTGGRIRLVFTGTLVRNVREPDYVLDLLNGLPENFEMDVDFYVMGNAATKIKNQGISSGLRIRNHGQVSKIEAEAAVGQSNVVLNIGEFEGKQISSKVFEYMAAGKPIVHFSYVEDDAITKILGRYPLALCLVQAKDRTGENRRRFQEFVARNANVELEFEEVASKFPEALPATTARILRHTVMACSC